MSKNESLKADFVAKFFSLNYPSILKEKWDVSILEPTIHERQVRRIYFLYCTPLEASMKKQYKYQIYALGFQYSSTPNELLLVKSCDNHFLLTHGHPHGVEFALLLSMFVLFLPFQFIRLIHQ